MFPGGKEFERAPWTTVPAPKRPTERRAAYVFEASSSPSGTFYLPPASQAITPDSEGTSGYAYSLLVYPGNATLYVLAGLEDRSVSPPSFVPYSMGIARGVSVPAQGRVDLVDVKMDILFDHEVRVSAAAPAPGPRGPDRLTTSLAITLGASAYAILPNNTRTSPLPAPSIFTFTGFPALDHGLANEQYVLGGVASTGPGQQLPASVVSRVRTTNANDVVSLGGFLGVPVLDEPGAGVWSGKHVSFGGAVGPIDLSVTTVSSSTVGWTIVAPGTTTSFDLPDLAAVTSADPVGLDHGAITTTTYVARIDQFTYGRLRAGQLGAGAWNAYAVDTLGGVY